MSLFSSDCRLKMLSGLHQNLFPWHPMATLQSLKPVVWSPESPSGSGFGTSATLHKRPPGAKSPKPCARPSASAPGSECRSFEGIPWASHGIPCGFQRCIASQCTPVICSIHQFEAKFSPSQSISNIERLLHEHLVDLLTIVAATRVERSSQRRL